MIDIIKQTPAVYSLHSRDYLLIARLFTALYNDSLMFIDNMHVWEQNIDNKLTELRASTLNFTHKHEWDYDSLDSAITCFKYISRIKGTLTAIEYCILVLMRVYNLAGDSAVELDSENKYNFVIKIPTQIATIGVVLDLLDHVLPAGLSYRIVQYKLLDYSHKVDVGVEEQITDTEIANSQLGIYNGTINDSATTGNLGYRIYHNAVQGPVDLE